MNLLNKILSFAMSFLLFAGSVGLDVYIHECTKDGKTISLFIQPDDPCDSRENEIESSCESSCCASEKGISPEDCCKESVELFQISPEFTQKKDSRAKLVQASNLVYFKASQNIFIAAEANPPNLSPNPPPNKLGRDILIENQTFLI